MTKISIDQKKIKELLSRSISEVLPSRKELEQRLLEGKKLKIYIGADATGPALHVGHATNYIVLERFRKLGHKIVILIGDFTARIGDPTDKTAARVELSREQVVSNTKDWIKQISPIIDFNDKDNPPEIVYNNDWLAKLTFEDLIKISSNFTVQQMLERDMFEKRMKDNKPIYLHEFLYPLAQGYDSVAMDVDIELCGTDQTFNALAGRTLLKKIKNKNKFVVTTNLLENPKTGKKMMSKSEGTGIYLNATANDMYGQVMAQPDENIKQLFIDCTHVLMERIDDIEKELKSEKTNPRNIKMELAYEITKIYHGEINAKKASQEFEKVFSQKKKPTDIEEFKIDSPKMLLVDMMIESGIATSKSDARRLIEQGAVKLNDEKIIDRDAEVVFENDDIIQSGKRNFRRIKLK